MIKVFLSLNQWKSKEIHVHVHVGSFPRRREKERERKSLYNFLASSMLCMFISGVYGIFKDVLVRASGCADGTWIFQ